MFRSKCVLLFAVGLGQASRYLVDYIHSLFRLERPLSDSISNRLALHVLHGDVGPALVLADLMDDADVGVGERRGRLGFDEEPFL